MAGKSKTTKASTTEAASVQRRPKQLAQQPGAIASGGVTLSKRDVTSLTGGYRRATEALETMRGTMAKAGIELAAT